MPIYEYHCRKCAQDFELMRRVAQMDDAAKCSNCGSRATKRKLSTFALVVSHSNSNRDDAADTDLDMQYGDGHDHGGHDDDDFDDDDY
jgi:putative FmdB family regulatory protein